MVEGRLKCPAEDLGEIVKATSEAMFFMIFRKPDKQKIAQNIDPFGNLSDEDEVHVERQYQEALKFYEEHADIRTKLLGYFGLKQEDIEKEDLEEFWLRARAVLIKHVEELCPQCRTAYTDFLDIENYHNRLDAEQRGEEYDRILKIKELDRMYWGLMQF